MTIIFSSLVHYGHVFKIHCNIPTIKSNIKVFLFLKFIYTTKIDHVNWFKRLNKHIIFEHMMLLCLVNKC